MKLIYRVAKVCECLFRSSSYSKDGVQYCGNCNKRIVHYITK